jgi:hypothetical protein
MLKNLSSRELQLLLLGSCSAVIYFFIVMFVSIYGMQVFAFQLFYLISATLFPFGLFFIFKRCFSAEEETLNRFGLWLLFSNLLLIGGLCFLTPPYSLEIAMIGLSIWTLIQVIFCILHGWNTVFFKKIIEHPWFYRLMCAMIALIPCVAFVNTLYSLFLKSGYTLLQAFHKQNQNLFIYVLAAVSILVITLLVQVFVFEKRKASNFSKYYTIFLCFSPILLFDVMNDFDVEHYNAYVAPAIAVLHGKIPLIDVFCHYGFSYLLFTLVFLFLPNNYAVLGAVISGLNVWCLILFLFMLKRVIKNPTYFLLLSITTVFGSHYLLAHSENLIPSAIAMRYFPTYLIMYCLFNRFYDDRQVIQGTFFRSPMLFFLLTLNALWSLESILFLLIMVSAYFWLTIDSWKKMCIAVAKLVAFIFGVYLAIAILYALIFHDLPSYKTYIKYIYYYMDPNTKIGARFLFVNNGFLSRFLIWIPMAIMHVVGLFYLLYHRFVKKINNNEIKSLLFINAVGVSSVVYFIFQPSLFTFICTGYPSLLVLVGGLVQLKEKTKSNCFRFGVNASLIIMTYMFLLIMSLSIKSRPATAEPSGNILTQFLYDGNFFHENFFYNLNNFCTKKVLEDRHDILAITENTCKRNSYHQEMYDLIEKWFKNEDEILLFHRDSTEALVEHKKIHRLLVSPLNDYLSYDIRSHVMGKVGKSVHLNDIVIVDKDLNFFPIEISILKKIDTLFNFLKLEETPHFSVFKLTKKDPGKESDLVFPIEPKGAVSSVVYRGNYKMDEVTGGVGALFDYDKETSWFATANNTFSTSNFWVKINLGKEYFINNIKMWRNIDFRVPEYVSKRHNIFPVNFNIKLSEDGEKWSLEKYESNYSLNQNSYYNAIMGGKKAQYIMINVLLQKNQSFFISEVEVFGKEVVH